MVLRRIFEPKMPKLDLHLYWEKDDDKNDGK
jgi:hypothetical protein